MRFSKILLVSLGLLLLSAWPAISQAGVRSAGRCGPQAAYADGGAPLPRPPLLADGGAPLPRPPLEADGGAPLPRPPLASPLTT